MYSDIKMSAPGLKLLKTCKFPIDRIWGRFQVLLPVILLLLNGCASIQTPTGGQRDRTPPKVIRETPANQTLNFNLKRIQIQFDEFFKLSQEFKEITISPALEKNPEYKVKKKVLEINFTDTLQKNTTYTINFGKGIVDFNEGNILKNYSYVFSTGPVIDSLEISGTVTDALTGKAELEATVILTAAEPDTLFKKRKAAIYTLTDSAGNFALKNLKPANYRLYALKEQGGGDRIYNSAVEKIGFVAAPVLLTQDTSGFKMRLFKEVPENFRLIDRKIEADGRLSFIFNRPLREPALRILNPAALDARKTTEFMATRDSAFVWLPEMAFDSLQVEILEGGIPLDTALLRKSRTATYTQAITLTGNSRSSRLRERQDYILTASYPIQSIDGSKFTILEDSIEVSGAQVTRDSSTRKLRLKYTWLPKKQYILKVAEGAITGINGTKSKALNDAFLLEPDESFAVLQLVTTVPDTAASYVVQLIGGEAQVLQSVRITTKGLVSFSGISPGSYKVRVVYDENKNGIWDTGILSQKKQPELIWISPAAYSLRANFELKEDLLVPPKR